MLKLLLKKALFLGAFFVFVFPVFNVSQAQQSCHLPINSKSEKALVKWVYDGDTLLVTDLNGSNERKIRILGIDTPEVKHHQQKAQLFGAKAREELRALLKQQNYQIILEFDKDKRDRYDRELAYTYLSNGESISEWLLMRGYAKTLIIPPNVKYADCFKRAEKYAQQKNLRLWKLKRNQVKAVSDLSSKAKGYIRLKGNVSRVKKRKKSFIFELKSKFKKPIQVRIKKKNLDYFKEFDTDKLVSKEVIVSGILKKKKGKRTIHLNHPSQLEISSAQEEQTQKVVPTIKWSLEK